MAQLFIRNMMQKGMYLNKALSLTIRNNIFKVN